MCESLVDQEVGEVYIKITTSNSCKIPRNLNGELQEHVDMYI